MRERRRRLISSTSRRNVRAWSAPSSPARAMNARMSLGRQPPPKPMPALRNLRPIRSSWPIASASWDDVRAGGLADLGHGVDERDLGGQERVGGDLDQLGGREVGDQARRAGGQRCGVHLVQQGGVGLGGRPGDAVHEPVRGQGVLDGEALAQELGVPGQARPACRRARPAAAARAAGRRCRPAPWTCPRPARRRSGAGPARRRRRRRRRCRRRSPRGAAGCPRRGSARAPRRSRRSRW